MRHDRYERVNFERERRKIFKLYRGTQILEKIKAESTKIS